jgi:hypothetical protein
MLCHIFWPKAKRQLCAPRKEAGGARALLAGGEDLNVQGTPSLSRGRRPFKPSAMGGRERRASLWNPAKSALIKDLKVVKGVVSRIAQNARI